MVVLNAAGYGYATITVPAGVRWEINLASVSTNASSAVGQPVATIYRDSAPNPARFVEKTAFGNGNSTDSVYRLNGGEHLTAEWVGGTAGAAATFLVSGMQSEV